jgi:hypothetical protein
MGNALRIVGTLPQRRERRRMYVKLHGNQNINKTKFMKRHGVSSKHELEGGIV